MSNSNTAPSSTPAEFFIVADGDQTVGHVHGTIEDAREKGREIADNEILPCTISIQDADGNHQEDVARSDAPESSAADRELQSHHGQALVA